MDFSFRKVYLDIERWLEQYGPDRPRDKEVRQVGKYGKAERIVLAAYYKSKAYKALVAHELGMNVIVGYESPKLHRLSFYLTISNLLSRRFVIHWLTDRPSELNLQPALRN